MSHNGHEREKTSFYKLENCADKWLVVARCRTKVGAHTDHKYGAFPFQMMKDAVAAVSHTNVTEAARLPPPRSYSSSRRETRKRRWWPTTPPTARQTVPSRSMEVRKSARRPDKCVSWESFRLVRHPKPLSSLIPAGRGDGKPAHQAKYKPPGHQQSCDGAAFSPLSATTAVAGIAVAVTVFNVCYAVATQGRVGEAVGKRFEISRNAQAGGLLA